MLARKYDLTSLVSKYSIIYRAVARVLIGGGGGECSYIHIFRFCPTNFFSNEVDFKRN